MSDVLGYAKWVNFGRLHLHFWDKHVLQESIDKNISLQMDTGKRNRGRPKSMWVQTVVAELEEMLSLDSLQAVAKDRLHVYAKHKHGVQNSFCNFLTAGVYKASLTAEGGSEELLLMALTVECRFEFDTKWLS